MHAESWTIRMHVSVDIINTVVTMLTLQSRDVGIS